MESPHLYHYVYKTINLINNKVYYGKRSTRNLHWHYLGSGEIIQKAIQKYGKENFTHTPIEFFNSSKEAFAAEARLVTREIVDDPRYYNLKLGGYGNQPGTVICKNIINNENMLILQNEFDNNPNLIGTNHKMVTCKDIITGESRRVPQEEFDNSPNLVGVNYNKPISNTAKTKLSTHFKKLKWINNVLSSKRVQLSEIDSYLKNGWKLGRH